MILHALKNAAMLNLTLACAAVAASAVHNAALSARYAPPYVTHATTAPGVILPDPKAPDAADADWDTRGTAAADSSERSGDAVLIMHRGRVVFERYDRRWTAQGGHARAGWVAQYPARAGRGMPAKPSPTKPNRVPRTPPSSTPTGMI